MLGTLLFSFCANGKHRKFTLECYTKVFKIGFTSASFPTFWHCRCSRHFDLSTCHCFLLATRDLKENNDKSKWRLHLQHRKAGKEAEVNGVEWEFINGTAFSQTFRLEREKRNVSEDFHLFWKLSSGMSCTIWISSRNFCFLLTNGKCSDLLLLNSLKFLWLFFSIGKENNSSNFGIAREFGKILLCKKQCILFSHTTGSHAKPNHAAWPLLITDYLNERTNLKEYIHNRTNKLFRKNNLKTAVTQRLNTNKSPHVTYTPRTLAPRLPDVCEKNVFHFFRASASRKQHLSHVWLLSSVRWLVYLSNRGCFLCFHSLFYTLGGVGRTQDSYANPRRSRGFA